MPGLPRWALPRRVARLDPPCSLLPSGCPEQKYHFKKPKFQQLKNLWILTNFWDGSLVILLIAWSFLNTSIQVLHRVSDLGTGNGQRRHKHGPVSTTLIASHFHCPFSSFIRRMRSPAASSSVRQVSYSSEASLR
jgi:hypothetical protein